MALTWQDQADLSLSNPSYEVFFPELMRIEVPQPQMDPTPFTSSAESSYDDSDFPPYQFVTYFDAYTETIDDHEPENGWEGWGSVDSPGLDEFSLPAPVIPNPTPLPQSSMTNSHSSKYKTHSASTSVSCEDDEEEYNCSRNFICPIDGCGRRYKYLFSFHSFDLCVPL